jgi:hypothetical protein
VAQPKTAAQAIYPHLPSGAREPVQQRTPTVADAMYPGLSREAKSQEALAKRNRDNILRWLREANGKGRR